MNDIYKLNTGSSPLLISVPHAGTQIPEALQNLFTPKALQVADTDWYLDTLYDFAIAQGASLIAPQFSRYVIDLNRPPEDAPMYPGVNNTGLCPFTDFEGASIYKEGSAPDAHQIATRRMMFWQPYHAAIEAELARIKSVHGFAVLLDGHSIKSHLPWLFEGQLPDLNIGTANGSSCSKALREAIGRLLESQQDYSHVIDGRFKGGYITRNYGQPDKQIHAIQLEMCWSTYMTEQSPYVIDPQRQLKITALLQQLTQLLAKGVSHD